MPQVIGERTTAQAAAESRAVRQVGDKIALLEPNTGPLLTLMTRMNRKDKAFQTKVEWIEDDYVARWDQNSATTLNNNTNSTAMTVTDGSKFVAGQMFVVPKVNNSTAAPEVVRVLSVAGNALTLFRAVGGVGLDTIPGNAPLRLIGTAYEEGAPVPNMKSTAPVTNFNYTQIFRNALDFSKTNAAIKQYGIDGSDRTREQNKKMKEHKIDIAGALYWGVRSESLTGGPTGKPIRTMGGVNSFITTNIFDVNGVLDWKGFETFSRMTFRYGSRTKLLFAAPKYCSAINTWGHNFLHVSPGETKLGVKIQTIETAHGTFKLVNDWMLEDNYPGNNGFGHVAFALDMDEIVYKPLSNNGINRDTQFLENIVRDGRDAFIDEYLTETTMEVHQEKYHAKMVNMTDYQA